MARHTAGSASSCIMGWLEIVAIVAGTIVAGVVLGTGAFALVALKII